MFFIICNDEILMYYMSIAYSAHVILNMETCRHLRLMFPDSTIASSIRCAATKATQVTNCIGEKYRSECLHVLRTRPFSLMIDESTDSSDKVPLSIPPDVTTRYSFSQEYTDLIPPPGTCNVGSSI